MIKKTFKINGSSFRKLDDPFENGKSKKYVFYANVKDVPEGIPMATNPREQKLTSGVATAIRESLESNDSYFHLKNRGIVISAAKVIFNNRTDEVTIEFKDDQLHGNVDGGHTYKIICENDDEKLDQYVQFEVMTGVEDIIEDLARARNTSVQVDEKSMAELANKFEPIKEGLEGLPFYKRIAFKQNQVEQDDETGKNLKMIDAREVVAIISMFDIAKYSNNSHPIQAYSSKAQMLKYYLEDPDYYRKLINIMPDIFDLYDAIETDFADAYNNSGGRYGRKKFSGYKDGKTVGKSKFFQKELTYRIPDGLVYPTLAAFRALVVEDENGNFVWNNNIEPLEVWDKHKNGLTNKIMSFSASIGDNPNTVGKDSMSWDIAYMTIMLEGQKSGGI